MSLDDRSLSGRRAQAAANDEVILRAARDVLIVASRITTSRHRHSASLNCFMARITDS